MKIGIITGREITKNRDAENDSLLLQAELSDADDIQTVELVSQCGEQYIPRDGAILFIEEVGKAWKIAIASSDEIAPDETLEPGERKTYSIGENNQVMACIRFKVNGTLVLNEGEDFAVRFSALESAFNDLQSKWNTFIAAYIPGGPTVQGAPAGTPPNQNMQSNADISEARIDTIQVP